MIGLFLQKIPAIRITTSTYRIANIPTPIGVIKNRDGEYSTQTYESFQSRVSNIVSMLQYTLYKCGARS